MSTPTLWHYTCEHHAGMIGATGELVSATVLASPAKRRRLPWYSDLVWLTDMAVPVRDVLGLSSLVLDCDRTTHRYRVTDTERCYWYPDARRVFPEAWRDELERVPGVLVRHWYVSTGPVPVELDLLP